MDNGLVGFRAANEVSGPLFTNRSPRLSARSHLQAAPRHYFKIPYVQMGSQTCMIINHESEGRTLGSVREGRVDHRGGRLHKPISAR